MAGEVNILFIASQRFEAGKAVRGAMLLTDQDTKPLEFRCTNPIRPTSLQTVLYGQMLDSHVAVELIGVPLVNSLKQPPTLVVVREPELLGLRSKIATPVVLLTKESAISMDSDSDGRRTSLLSSASGQFDPVVLVAHSDFGDDIGVSMPLLTKVFNRFDLIEPFNRINTALEQVHQQKIGETK